MKNAKVYVAEQTDATTNTKTNEAYVSNKVTATGLSANTVYYYSYEKEDGTYTEPAEYLSLIHISITLHFNIVKNGLKMVFRSVRFHFPLKSRFLYRQKIILTDYLEYLQIVCRIIGGDCCWIVCYVHISRIQTN